MEAILDRIKKLFRLADNNPNENEAAAAMAKARAMMQQHNIDHVTHDAPDAHMKPMRGKTHGGLDKRWQRFLANGIAKMFYCRTTTNQFGCVAFWGREDNVTASEETWISVIVQIERLYKLTLREFGGELSKQQRGDLRQTFKESAALRVCHRCNDIIAASERGRVPDHMALVVVNTTNEEIDELWKQHGVKTSKTKKVRRLRYGLGTGAGLAAGDQVRLQKEVK